MKYLYLIPILALGACAQNPLISGPNFANSAYDANVTYAGALQAMLIYGETPVCAPGAQWSLSAPCHDPATWSKIKLAQVKAKSLANTAEQAAINNPGGLSTITAIGTAQTAISAFSAAIPK
jgi:hypothetical protein